MATEFKDFAFGKRGIPSLRTLLIVMGLAVAAVLAVQWVYHQKVVAPREAARTQAWTVAGPPCLSVAADQYELRGGAHAKKVTDFGVRFTRQYGHVECTWLGDKDLAATKAYVICQFTGPNVLKVETAKGVFYYVPGVGQPATIEVHQGEPRCVLASNFKP